MDQIVAQLLFLGLTTGAIFALLAGGMTLVYSVVRTVFPAHGDVLALAMYAGLTLYRVWGLHPYLTMVLITPLMFGLGLLCFRVFLKPVLRHDPMIFFQIGLGLIFISEELMRVGYGIDGQTVTTPFTVRQIHIGPILAGTGQLIALGAGFALCIASYYVLQRTSFGRSIRAVAERPDLAKLFGIRVERMQAFVFAAGFVLAGIAGSLVLPFTSVQPYMGLSFTLYAVIVLTVGTMGNFIGSLVAGMVIGIASTASNFLMGDKMAAAVPYVIFILVLILLPRGLFGSREAR
ncbi:MAG: branched-chain amino acid ABC transporter permease [Chloroflexota bacterium]|nr:MAG: branched-chain amino acid ABC transporter permease [Chloroflexota bacterium]